MAARNDEISKADDIQKKWLLMKETWLKASKQVCGMTKGPPRHKQTWWLLLFAFRDLWNEWGGVTSIFRSFHRTANSTSGGWSCWTILMCFIYIYNSEHYGIILEDTIFHFCVHFHICVMYLTSFDGLF